MLHCFSSVDRLDEALERGYSCSFAGNVAYPKAERPARGRRGASRRPHPGRDRRALPGPAAAPRPPEPARLCDAHAGRAGRRARCRAGRARSADRRERDPRLRPVSGAQVSLARMREFGIAPTATSASTSWSTTTCSRSPAGCCRSSADDVVLEVGAGLGVLTAWLARRVALVHAIEVDRRLEPALTATLARRRERQRRLGRRARLDPADARPGARRRWSRTCPTTWPRR